MMEVWGSADDSEAGSGDLEEDAVESGD